MLGPRHIFFSLTHSTLNRCEVDLTDQGVSQPGRQRAATPVLKGVCSQSLPRGPPSSKLAPRHTLGVGRKAGGGLAHTYPRKEGEEVVLLVVDDISGVPLIPLLGVPQPDRAGPGLSPTTASQPLTAPAGETSPQCQGQGLLSMFFSKASAPGTRGGDGKRNWGS